MAARPKTRHVNRERSTASPQAPRGSKQIVIPMIRQQYEELWFHSSRLRTFVDGVAGEFPELFPAGFQEGYACHGFGRESRKAPGVKLLDKPAAGGYPTPVSDATGSDHVWVGRVRQDSFDPLGIGMWLVSDNLRKGVALNSLAIAQLLIKDYL